MCIEFAPPPPELGAAIQLTDAERSQGKPKSPPAGASFVNLARGTPAERIQHGDFGETGNGRWRASLAESGKVGSSSPRLCVRGGVRVTAHKRYRVSATHSECCKWILAAPFAISANIFLTKHGERDNVALSLDSRKLWKNKHVGLKGRTGREVMTC